MADVEAKRTNFTSLLVCDVSRWGRFQDVDESAYYEYVLKRAGIRVHYCAEQFENDGSMSSSVLKTLKRSMAAEYSRELSVKVFSGQCRLIELGFRQGGPAGFGLRRQLIDRNQAPKGLLGRGERKGLQTDRVILVPGPENEIEVVQKIYTRFVADKQTEREIAEQLNRAGILGEHSRLCTRATVHQVLINPKYIGANVYNRRSFKEPPEVPNEHTASARYPAQAFMLDMFPPHPSQLHDYRRGDRDCGIPCICLCTKRLSVRHRIHKSPEPVHRSNCQGRESNRHRDRRLLVCARRTRRQESSTEDRGSASRCRAQEWG